ncbi:polyprenol monophosphomannose synthase [Corynebacterium ulceribovis]|uniref:polyprenol monophosphomannose synthase n=1 Tax=Corynebacterium ulceribovis TaxID=487732 RepID=UPI000367717C|nr:polyprenol monophosphomannose synthase [Corynebacterium ulceribovis]
MTAPSDKTLVIIPTFNERESLPDVVRRTLEANPEVHILVVDDSSPDGTGEIAEELAKTDIAERGDGNGRIFVKHRATKDGLYGAYKAGFEWGLERDYQVLCEMDADGSHQPEQLHLLLEAVDAGADLVIGSRYVPGGKTVNWPLSRLVLSKGGNLYIGMALGTGIKDITAGYRAFRREVLETLDLDAVTGSAYLFQTDLGRKAVYAEFDVREVPITFIERETGESKMSGSFVTESLSQVTMWGFEHWGGLAKDISGELFRLGKHGVQQMLKRPDWRVK